MCREELERFTRAEVECMTNSEGLRYYNRVCRLELERLISTEVKCMRNSEGLYGTTTGCALCTVQGGAGAAYQYRY